MKVKVLGPEYNFKPFQLVIDIENEAELLNIYHRINVSLNRVLDKNSLVYEKAIKAEPEKYHKLFEPLYRIMEDNNLIDKMDY